MKNQNYIKELLGKNRLEEAIREMKLYVDNNTEMEIIQVEGRLNELKRKINLGLLSNQEQELERNKIAKALIEIVSGKETTIATDKTPTLGSSRHKIIIFSTLLFSVFIFTLLFANKTLPFSEINQSSYLIYVLCGLLAAYTCYGLLSSYSEIKGQKYGLNIRMGGSIVAMLVVTFGGGYYEKNMQTTSSFDIRIRFVSENGLTPQKLNGKLSLFLGNEEKYQNLNNQSSVLFQGISNKWRNKFLNLSLESSQFEIDITDLKNAKITDETPITLKVKFVKKYAKPEEVQFDIFFKEATTVTYGPKENTKILSLIFDVHSHSDYVIPLDKKAELHLFGGCYRGLLELKRYDYVYLHPREFDELLFECEVSDEIASELVCSLGSFYLKYHPLIEKSDSTWRCNVIFDNENIDNL